MASKVARTEPTQPKILYLVDSESEKVRSELETSCRKLIFNFIEMKDNNSICTNRQSILQPSKNTITSIDTSRGTTLKASSVTSIASKGSSVDIIESSVDLLAMDNEVYVLENVDIASNLVPIELPANLKDNISQVELEDLRKLYNIEACAQVIKNEELSRIEVIMLHLRSYRNIAIYEDVEMLRERFVNFFGSIFADLMNACYPNERGDDLVSNMFTH